MIILILNSNRPNKKVRLQAGEVIEQMLGLGKDLIRIIENYEIDKKNHISHILDTFLCMLKHS